MRLCSETEFPEHVLCRLLENYLEKKTPKKVLEALAYRWHRSSSFMGRITIFMDYNDSDVRRAAINALREQSPWSPDILEAVMCRLENDEDVYVRRVAIRALGTQSPWSSEVL
jgi:HEAT repeat protein